MDHSVCCVLIAKVVQEKERSNQAKQQQSFFFIVLFRASFHVFFLIHVLQVVVLDALSNQRHFCLFVVFLPKAT